MKILIVYDSIFGNTATIAKTMAERLAAGHDVTAITVQDAQRRDLSGIELLIIGSPTRGFQPTPGISQYIGGLTPPAGRLTTAVFDTRLDLETINPPPLRWVVDVGGYAGRRMAKALQAQGFVVHEDCGAFRVSGTEGPLGEGELARAADWASNLLVTAPETLDS